MRHNYLGALHIHSTYSDGTKDVDYIIRQAAKAGLKWIIITDHNTHNPLKHEGFYDGVCVVVGCEITPRKANHLLAFGTKEDISEEIGERNYIDEVHKQGGICFAAHPDESIHRDNPQSPLRWEDWSIDTLDGLEIWNYLTDWTDNYSVNKNKLLQYLNRHNMAKGPTKNVLAWWDRLNNSKKHIVPAIGGMDAHAFRIGRHGFLVRIADYYDFFKSLNNLISLDEPLSNDFQEAKAQIINALKNANNIILNRRVCSNFEVDFYIENKGQRTYCGQSTELDKYSKLVIKLPKKATIRLIHNGVLVYEVSSKVLEYDRLEAGKYRAEIFANNKPWIFTNPIKVV